MGRRTNTQKKKPQNNKNNTQTTNNNNQTTKNPNNTTHKKPNSRSACALASVMRPAASTIKLASGTASSSRRNLTSLSVSASSAARRAVSTLMMPSKYRLPSASFLLTAVSEAQKCVPSVRTPSTIRSTTAPVSSNSCDRRAKTSGSA